MFRSESGHSVVKSKSGFLILPLVETIPLPSPVTSPRILSALFGSEPYPDPESGDIERDEIESGNAIMINVLKMENARNSPATLEKEPTNPTKENCGQIAIVNELSSTFSLPARSAIIVK